MTHPEPTAGPADAAVPLRTPRDGVPAVIESASDLASAARALAGGTGPVAVDAERASGYRYGQRAYLVQLRREGAGTLLLDPLSIGDPHAVQSAIGTAEWILHAASQDLPCLAELGLRPTVLFDTELAGRLLGRQRVGLGSLVERELGFALEKGYAAADWSTRPLPEPWLRYAALDVELLIELRAVLAAELERTGKAEWAREEFAALVTAPGPAPRSEPWRRTSGVNRVRQPRRLAVVRALWQARDEQARAADLSPGRVLPDAAIVAAATAMPGSRQSLLEVPGFGGRGQRRRVEVWWRAVESALALPDDRLPTASLPADGPPPPRAWRDRDPAAAARLARARTDLIALAERLDLPVENLVSPDVVRRVMWSPPSPAGTDEVEAACLALGARAWQAGLVAAPLAMAIGGRPVGSPSSPRPEPVADRASG